MPLSHLCQEDLCSILQLDLLPALGVVQDLRRQLIDPPLKCGDRAFMSELVEKSGRVVGGHELAAKYDIRARSCEHWLDLVQRRLAWLVTFTIGDIDDKDYNLLFCFKKRQVLCIVVFL